MPTPITIKVKDNQDNSLLNSMFHTEQRSRNRAAFEPICDPRIEPLDTYIPPAGVPTFRGSKPRPSYGSPADLVYREEAAGHINMDRNFKAPPKDKTNFIIDDRAVPPDIRASQFKDAASVSPETSFNKQPSEQNNPYSVEKENDNMHYVAVNDRTKAVLPPLKKPEPRWVPTDDDIVQVLGYNATNVKILAAISQDISDCSNLLNIVNDSTKAIDLREILTMMSVLDNTKFRKMLADTLNTMLTEKLALSTKVTSYLNSTATIEITDNSSTGSTENSDTSTPSVS